MDVNQRMWCVDCQAFIDNTDLLSHMVANPSHGLSRIHHNDAGIPEIGVAPFVGAGTGGAIYVDGSKAALSYTPDGSEALPYKTLQDGLDACPRLGTVRVKKAIYVENIVTVADKYLDAEMGTILSAMSGDTLTLTDDVTPFPAGTVPPFWRGLLVEAEDPAGWAIRINSGGTWAPFLVWLDQGLQIRNHANGVWVEGGGLYLTDAGGIEGSPQITIRVGNSTSQIGGYVICGSNKLSCNDGGTLFDIHENSFVLADRGDLSAGGPGAVLAQLNGLDTPGTGVVFIMKTGSSDDPWRSLVRATGGNSHVQIHNNYSGTWAGCADEAIYMPDGGYLELIDFSAGSTGRQALIFGNNATPSNGNLNLIRTDLATNGGHRAIEIRGYVDGTLRECTGHNRNMSGLGAILLEHQGNLTLEGGGYEGIGPTCEHVTGNLYLLGGVDLVAWGSGSPGGVPLASAAGANLYRGHCNFRGASQPVIASVETLLPSSFGIVGFGASAATVRMSASASSLPNSGYPSGSLFVYVPSGGPALLYLNQGTEASPDWRVIGPISMLQASGEPNAAGAVGLYIGHQYQDTDTGAVYVCVSLAPSVWDFVGAPPGNAAGNPDGVVTGALGQMYLDSNDDVLYVCTGGTSWRVV